MKIYTLTVIKEAMDEFATVKVNLYANPEAAVEAYNKAFDEAQAEAEDYKDVNTDDEVVTDTPYRWFAIYDDGGSYNRITIELDAKEVI